jgi:lysophospholipase L1-like esterase
MKRILITILLMAVMAVPIISVSGDGPTQVVSCLGDSITEGIPYSGTENTYPARLQAMLDAVYGSGNFEVVNHGVGGWRADQVRDHSQGWMEEDNPDVVLLLVGGNDLAQEANPFNVLQVIAQTVAEVQEIVNIVKAHTNPDSSHPRIIVSAMIPTQDVWESLALSWYNTSLANDLTGVDLWTTSNWADFYDSGTGKAKSSLMADKVHPNVSGYTVMAENWFEGLDSLIGPTAVTLSSFSARSPPQVSGSPFAFFRIRCSVSADNIK